ncbi:MAG: hypothetical protein ACI4HI_07780 [Lachnospiraceae bacterium]
MFNSEQIAKAKECKTVDELVALSKGYGQELTTEQAELYLKNLNRKTEDLSDEELENVVGGCEVEVGPDYKKEYQVQADGYCSKFVRGRGGNKDRCCECKHVYMNSWWACTERASDYHMR